MRTPAFVVIGLLTSLSTYVMTDTVEAAIEEQFPVIVRVRLVSEGGNGSRVFSDEVELLDIIKGNEPDQFPRYFKVFYRAGDHGIPEGVSTVSLKKYDSSTGKRWWLIGYSDAFELALYNETSSLPIFLPFTFTLRPPL